MRLKIKLEIFKIFLLDLDWEWIKKPKQSEQENVVVTEPKS